MGTNYYFKPAQTCDKCGNCNYTYRYHIGKSSGGWCFSLHVKQTLYIDDAIIDINDFEDWKNVFFEQPGIIVDEYNTPISYRQMIKIIESRSWLKPNETEEDRWTYLLQHRPSFFEKNQCTKGPAGLIRHKIDNRYCIGHGEGTWDLMIGEFS